MFPGTKVQNPEFLRDSQKISFLNNDLYFQFGPEKTTWFDLPWLFVECYLYAKLYEFVTATKHLKDYDLFHTEKTQAYYDRLVFISLKST